VTVRQDWRSRKRDETHQRIYEAAMRLFEQEGFDQVSVSHIASAAGVSVPTFYAHYPSKEHVVFLPVPTSEQILMLIHQVPADLPVGERIRAIAPYWFAQFPKAERGPVLARWRMVATTPSLRIRAAEFERTTADAVIEAISMADGKPLTGAERVVAMAYLAAFTSAFLTWADTNGARDLEEIVEEAFQALR
jgi:AcrR family transcriptional regulator